MNDVVKKRIQILSQDEIDELYERPNFSHADQKEYFVMDQETTQTVNTLDKLETKLYLILLIGYFRAKPVIAKFQLNEAENDIRYLIKTYFPKAKAQLVIIPKSTRSKLVSKMLSLLAFDRFTKASHEHKLADRLRDVATICNDPRYIFDECLAYFGQNRMALAAYSTLQDLVTKALSSERQRTETILSKKMNNITAHRLENILRNKGILNGLSGYRGSARNFSPSQIDRELQTHLTIKEVYPEIKVLISKLKLSQGNLTYYSSIIKHRSIYKIRRYPKWQGLLYLVCYLYFRYQESNDKLVTTFTYLRSGHDSCKKRRENF